LQSGSHCNQECISLGGAAAMRGFALALACIGLLGCDANTRSPDVGSAQAALVGRQLARPGVPGSGILFYFGLGPLEQTDAVHAEKVCEGAAGSVIPPLAVSLCGGELFSLPLKPFELLFDALDVKDPNRKVAMLRGIENHWVRQSNQNQCWAATLETARSFTGLAPRMSQSEIIGFVRKDCPKLEQQTRGADLYQVLFVLAKLIKFHDGNRLMPKYCHDLRCIIESISKQRPVIMFKDNHAVIVAGVEFNIGREKGQTVIIPKKFYVLDPATEVAKIETRSTWSMCTGDAFIAL
jgi:Papain-like cysteine protease AvrRpt2